MIPLDPLLATATHFQASLLFEQKQLLSDVLQNGKASFFLESLFNKVADVKE